MHLTIKFSLHVVAIGILLGSSPLWSQESRSTIPLKILYAGNPDSDRARDFEQLLSAHFEKAEVMNYGEFKPSDADDVDVVIFDWTSTYPRDEDGSINWDLEDGFSSPSPPPLPRDFDRPTVLIGAAGGTVGGRLDIAINWK